MYIIRAIVIRIIHMLFLQNNMNMNILKTNNKITYPGLSDCLFSFFFTSPDFLQQKGNHYRNISGIDLLKINNAG